MRIGFDAKRYFYNNSGLGNYSRWLVNALAKNHPNFQIYLFDPYPQGHKKHIINPDFSNITIVYPKSKSPFYRSFGIQKNIKAYNLDIFHGLSNEIPFFFRKPFHCKFVCTIHDVIFKQFPEYYPWLDRLIYDFKTKWALRKSDLVIATSQTTKKEINQFYPYLAKNIEVVYQTINPEFFETKADFSGNHLVYVGTYNKRKNHATLIEAFKIVAKQTPYNLVLVGTSGSELPRLKQLVNSYGLVKRVIFKENASTSELHNLLLTAQGLIYPSFHEGFGIPLVEAAAMGLPIAVSNIPIFKEFQLENAVYFHPNNAIEMAEALVAISQADMRFTVKTEFEQFSQQFMANQTTENLVQSYQKALLN